MTERILTGVMDGEEVLPQDYPVHWGYAYVADGKVIVSDVQGTVRDLRHDIGALEIRRCNMAARNLFR